jgi:hypothetical protein
MYAWFSLFTWFVWVSFLLSLIRIRGASSIRTRSLFMGARKNNDSNKIQRKLLRRNQEPKLTDLSVQDKGIWHNSISLIYVSLWQLIHILCHYAAHLIVLPNLEILNSRLCKKKKSYFNIIVHSKGKFHTRKIFVYYYYYWITIIYRHHHHHHVKVGFVR